MKKYIIFDLDWTLIKKHKVDIYEFLLKKIKNISEEKFVLANIIIEEDYWIRAKKLLEKIDLEVKQSEIIMKEIHQIVDELSDKQELFNDTVEIIEKLSQKYDLFISSVSSDWMVQNFLEKPEIKWKIRAWLWSSKIQKWVKHISRFKEMTNNKKFEKQSIFIWDSETDKILAQKSGIDFIEVSDWVSLSILEKIEKLRLLRRVEKYINFLWKILFFFIWFVWPFYIFSKDDIGLFLTFSAFLAFTPLVIYILIGLLFIKLSNIFSSILCHLILKSKKNKDLTFYL